MIDAVREAEAMIEVSAGGRSNLIARTGGATPPTAAFLTDQTQEIPPFLLRNPDGGFKHPDAAFAITATVSASLEVDALTEALEISRQRDAAVRRLLLMRDETLSKEQKFEQEQKRADKRAIKKAEQQRLLTNKLKQREVFARHFKWDHEK